MATEFSKMSDDELDLWIAKRLGWHCEFELPSAKHAYAKWIVYRPDGSRAGLPAPKNAVPDRLILYHAPKHTKSVDAALTLLPNNGKGYVIHLRGDGVLIRLPGKAMGRLYMTPSLARAICEAWAAMREAEDDNA